MKFYYQISCYHNHSYQWAVAYKGIITAADKKAAKLELNKMFDSNLKEKSSRGKEKPEFKIYIVELTKEWEVYWESVRECSVCKTNYSIMHSYQAGIKATATLCSDECGSVFRKPLIPEFLEEGYNNAKPCIYKITNKITNKVYIGKTTRPFTLRWWQHFYHPGETKFHKEISSSKITDWVFEVLEVIEGKPTHKEILAREQHYIDLFDSINSGYNSVASVT